MGQGKKPKEVKSNITDNESAKMKTSKGVIQGFNGNTAVDKKHQIIVDAQVFGAGPEQYALQLVLVPIEERYGILVINIALTSQNVKEPPSMLRSSQLMSSLLIQLT